MAYLANVPLIVPLFWRQNSGALKIDGRWIRLTWNHKGEAVRGISDILGVLDDGSFLAIEVKGPGKKPTKAQLYFINEINEVGGLAFVARSLDDVHEKLLAYKKQKIQNDPS